MISGYYIVPIHVFHTAAKEDPFQACAHQIDDTQVICWARFFDQGHEARFLEREGVQALPDVRGDEPVAEHLAHKLKNYGVRPGHTTIEVMERLAEIGGHALKLPSY